MLGHLGLCWRLSGLKFQPQRKHGSVEVEFWVGFGLMLGHLEATKNPRKILLFYACFFGRIMEPSWAYIVSSVGPF